MAGGFKDQATDIVMVVVLVLVVAAMALIIPDSITSAGFTGAAATIVGLIPMMIPVAVIVMLVMRLISGLKGAA